MNGYLNTGLSLSGIEARRLENVPQDVLGRFSGGWSKRTDFSIVSKGSLADRFFMDVNYAQDGQSPAAGDDSRILMRYKGKGDELLKSVELGDAVLDLPGSRWLSLKGKSGGVSRQSFSGKGVLSYKSLQMILMGAKQKGRPEMETFHIGFNVQSEVIRDMDYVQRRFYSIAPNADLPLDPASVSVFYDDGNNLNKTSSAERFIPAGGNKEGNFEKLRPGDPIQGIELDSHSGIIKFAFEVPFGALVAASYRTAAGKVVSKVLIKSGDDSVTNEVKNRYALPESMMEIREVRVQDRSGNRLGTPPNLVDTMRKLLIFESTRPFAPEVYAFPAANLNNIVISYIESGDMASVTLSKDPLKGSLKLELDGVPLRDGKDFSLSRGRMIRLFGIRKEGTLKVGYNAKDVSGSRQTLGCGVVYGEGSPARLCLSGLYDFAPRSYSAPELGGDSSEVRMAGAVLNVRKDSSHAGLKLDLEAAGSEYNPNPYGASIVENMSASRRAFPLELREEFWKPCSRPPGASGPRFRDSLGFGSVLRREIVPSDPTGRRESVFSLNSGPGEWSGSFRSLAPGKGALDLRSFRHLELRVFSDGSGGRLICEWGDVSEDINGNSRLDTEDKKGNGLLDASEDTGIRLENGVLFGAGNNLLDTEDVDLDGRLDTLESFAQGVQVIDWTGWRKISFPLKGVPSAKYLRIWVQGQASVKIAMVEFTGLEYSEERSPGSELNLGTVSDFSDPDAPSLSGNLVFRSLYPHGDGLETSNKNEMKETFALCLEYALPSGGTADARKDMNSDLSGHEELHFFAASTSPANVFLFLRLGTKENYFEYTLAASLLSSEYREFNVDKKKFNRVGSPVWEDIREIRIGVMNPSFSVQSGKIFFSEIFADKPVVLKALAFSGDLELSRKLLRPSGILSELLGKRGECFLKTSLIRVPDDFRTPDESLRGQEQNKVSAGWKSDQASLTYSMGAVSQGGLLSHRGHGMNRTARSFEKSQNAGWELKHGLGGWRAFLTGSFEKIERRESISRESLETIQNILEISNDEISSWAPARITSNGLYRKDLAFARDTWSGILESKWLLSGGRFSFTPRVEQEDVTGTQDHKILLEKSVFGVSQEAHFERLSFDSSWKNENEIRSFQSHILESNQSAETGLHYDEDSMGRSSLSGQWRESSLYSLGEERENRFSIWQLQIFRPAYRLDSQEKSVSAEVGQENIRLVKIVSRIIPHSAQSRKRLSGPSDWFSISLRSAVRMDQTDTYGLLSKELKVKFPDGMVTFSSGAWDCSAGGYLETMKGEVKKGQKISFPFQVNLKRETWEIRNSVTFERDLQTYFGSILKDQRRLFSKSTAKIAFRIPQLNSLKLLGRNICYNDRTVLTLDLESELKTGRENGGFLEENLIKSLERLDIFVSEQFKIYFSFDLWRFKNLLAPSRDYAAYTLLAGAEASF